MGRAARWLRGLLGGGKRPADGKPAGEKRRWGFVKSFREKEATQQQQHQRPAPAAYEARKGSYREENRVVVVVDEDAQSKRAIAVAAATAAVAEAAVAAAQAAAAVVRLTSSGRSAAGRFGGLKREDWAAVKIQATFRGYLARRALRALKGLVKLQALVRGNIVRKQAAETLRCMQALVRVQARARACRKLKSDRPRLHSGQPMQRNSSKQASSADSAGSERAPSSGWNWLDRWMEERYWDSREGAVTKAGSAAAVATSVLLDDEKNAKILEIDTGKPHQQKIKPKRRSSKPRQPQQPQSSCSTVTSERNSRSYTTVVDSPSKESTAAQKSILSPSSVDTQQALSPLRFPVVEDAELGDSPQFYSAASRAASSRRGPFTPAKSECSRSLFSAYSDYPNYMANTESSKAKVVRSQSAPRQRPEFETSASLKRMSAPANGFIGREPVAVVASAQRSSTLQAKFAGKAYPGSGRLDRLGMPIRY